MFTRKVDYIEMIADECLFDEATLDKLLEATTYMLPHEIDYTVAYIRGEADTISPSPYEIAKEVSSLVYDKIRSFKIAIDDRQFSDLFRSIKRDAEKWEAENLDMLILNDENEQRACHAEAQMDAEKELT